MAVVPDAKYRFLAFTRQINEGQPNLNLADSSKFFLTKLQKILSGLKKKTAI